MSATISPKRAVVGETVVLSAVLENATKRARVRFRIFVDGNSSDEVDVINSDQLAHHGMAHATWKVDVGQRPLSVMLRFEATMPAQPGSGSVVSDAMRVSAVPPKMSAWFAHGLRGSSGGNNVATNPVAQQELNALLALSRAKTGEQTLNDFSAVFTIRTQKGGEKIEWDRGGIFRSLTTSQDSQRHDSFAKLIEICHAHEVKVYAGYEAASVKSNVDNFMEFAFRATTLPPSAGADRPVKEDVVQAHAEAIHHFLFVDPKTALPWDGFGFDIEIGALKSPYAPMMKSLIHKLADLMAPKPVTYASYGFTAPGTGPNGMVIGGKNDFFNSQPFEIAKGKTNVITRPMMYEAPMGSEAAARKYTKEVIAFALDTVGLQPHQLQIGHEVQKQPVVTEPGKPPPKVASGILSVPTLKKVIEHEQAPREAGLILFGLFMPQRAKRMREFAEHYELYREHGP